MKLELKHLAPYLPYGLKYLYLKKEDAVWMDNSKDHYHTLLSYCEKGYHSKSAVGVTMFYKGEFTRKPILRPLSDLTKDIEVNGVKIWGKGEFSKHDWDKFSEHPYALLMLLDYDGTMKLIEWHFDVFGLIEAGLAIDINTLD
jgi:hypothetical protein